MTTRPQQITATPSEEFSSLWEAFKGQTSLKVKDWVCAGLLWLMSLSAEEREAWFMIYRSVEKDGFRELPEVNAGKMEFKINGGGRRPYTPGRK